MEGFSGGTATDLAPLWTTMHAIEKACFDIQLQVNPAVAEATIVALHQSSSPYQTCKFIIQNSQVPNARFQAAGGIRDAALREWGFLSGEDKKGLIIFCLSYVMEHAADGDSYVQAKISAVAAQLLKRGWIEFSSHEKQAFFSQVNNSVLGVHGPEVQYVGLNFLESLVTEFSLTASSPMGLPSEFHEQCASLFEVDCLKNFYCWAQEAAMKFANSILNSSSISAAEEKVCAAAMRLMAQILTWDFKKSDDLASNASGRKLRQDVALLKKFDRTLLQPGHAWFDVLLSSGHVVWVLKFYGTLRMRFLSDVLWFDSPLAVSTRQLIVQLCSLTGSIFPDDNGDTQEKYLMQLLNAIIQWLDPPDEIIRAISDGQSESEMHDGCHALLSIATLSSNVMFDGLLKTFRPFGTIQFLSLLTSEVLKGLAVCSDEDDTACSFAIDILLETWNVLLLRADGETNALSDESIASCAALFGSVMECQLKVAVQSAFDEDDGTEHFHASVSSRDERLHSYALVGRAAVHVTLPLLIRSFSDRCTLLYQHKGTSDPTCTLEELYWILLISGHILADSGLGETVLVPKSLLARFSDVTEATQHPAVVLPWSVIQFAERSGDPEIRAAFFSPRLMEAIIWFLARWADTYLMPVEQIEDKTLKNTAHANQFQGSVRVLIDFAGENNQGKALLDILVRISITTLVSYPGETELHALVCCQLLPALVRRKNVCSHLVLLDSWRDLANAFANDRNLLSIASHLQRFLAVVLVRSASVFQEPRTSHQYLRDLMGPITKFLADIMSKGNIKEVAQQPDVIELVVCLLERYRGATRATEPRTHKAVFDASVAIMSPVLTLMDVYKDETAIVSLIIKFAIDLVEAHIVFLNHKDTSVLVGFCNRILQMYSSHNIRKVNLSASFFPQSEKYKDLRALLKLLTSLFSKDMVDFSSETDGEESTDIAQVVYFGLHTVIPLMTLELLKYPKLSYQYFTLLSHLLEVYPEKVAQLNAEGFGHVVGTLDWGIRQQDIEVVDMCLRAVNALASYHFKERNSGRDGLGVHASGLQCANGKTTEGILNHFLNFLLKIILFEDFSMNLVGAAADALFPLILCEQELYQRLVHEIIAKQQSDVLKSRLADAFGCLTSSNQLSPVLDRPNRQRFRKNLHKFLMDVSGFLRAK